MYHCPARIQALSLLCAIVIFSGSVCAQVYPTKPVRVVVTFPPGSGVDIVTRLFTPKLTEILGQQFIVDNRAGAAGKLGAEIVVRASPDGYTLLAATASLAIGQSLYKNFSFDLTRDFEPVVLFASAPFMLVVHPSVPVRSVKELIALAKARPGELSFGSAGAGSGSHLSAELLKMHAHIDLLHVPYKGTGFAVTDLIGGRISMMMATNLLPHVRAGRLRAIAMTSAKRSVAAPELPTIAESGLPGFEAATWFALLAPARTPNEITTRLNAVITKFSHTPAMRDLLVSQATAEPMSENTVQVGTFIKNEIVKWKKVVMASGARVDE